MPIDKNQVKKVAKLSRISLDDKKIDSLSKDLDSILTFVEKLNELDTKEIKTLKSITDKTLEARNDIVDDGKIKNDILKNSPEKNEDFFIVPKVIE
jgi:aspartyl-tRNA(Asn)/glutamyl-tRNA(Gln) amidotransferase subunit C